MTVKCKIRGIYTTALTQLCIDNGVTVVSPSRVVAARFKGQKKIRSEDTIDVEIRDRDDSQGVVLTGDPKSVHLMAELIQNSFLDAICRKTAARETDCCEIEFPYCAKAALDGLRNIVVPTVLNHHRLRLIDSRYVDLAEMTELRFHPEKRESTSRRLEARLVWNEYTGGKEMAIDHVKLNGRVISLSEGEIIECVPGEKKIILKRKKFKGRASYDGLNVPKEEGDYAITEVQEGSFFYKHTYFRKSGEVIGEYYNINTPVEFYPGKIRYVDLEIDVVRWPDGRVEAIDEEELNRCAASGYLSHSLKQRAKDTARRLCR